jgi:hypothetical protein
MVGIEPPLILTYYGSLESTSTRSDIGDRPAPGTRAGSLYTGPRPFLQIDPFL